MEIKIINKSTNPLPKYATEFSAGLDLFAFIQDSIVLKPMEKKLIPTGIFIELPENFEAQVRPRSGLAIKYGITVLNSPGTIDADYRGEIKVILINLSKSDFTINNGERIAQLIVNKYQRISWLEVDELVDTERSDGGFGHTGKI